MADPKVRCRVEIMGKEGSLGKATKMQRKQIAACKAKKIKSTTKKIGVGIRKGYNQAANFVKEKTQKKQ